MTIANKVYDGNAVSYTGKPDVKDSEGNTITDVTLSFSYTGTLADGSEYTDVTKAPSLAGSYTLTVTISESDKYTADAVTCSFEITRKAITITAPSLSIYTGEALPALSSLKATVDGLLSGDTIQPQFKYGTDNISTKEEGTYDIIPFDADAGNNYSITYVNGTLTITKAEVAHEGASKNKKLTWTIDESGKLTVKGTGNYPTMKWGEDEEYDGEIVPEWHQWAESITSAEISVSGITTTENMFYDCCNLKSIDLTNLNTSKVTNMTWMFYGCNALETLDLTNLNTSKVTSMNSMFADCNALETLDVSGFNTSKVKSMSFMFDSCNALKTLDVSSFNTGNVTDMIAMFRFCSSLTDFDLSSFNTSKVKYMFEMFMGCENLENLDLSSFNTGNVIKMNEMFDRCSSLISLDLRNFNTGKAIDMNNMFSWCESLESLDISSFNTKNVGDMSYMFSGCYNLKHLDLSSFNTKNVWRMDGMFYDCTGLESLDLSNFDTGEVRYIDGMFWHCGSLTSLDLSSFDLKNLGNDDDGEDYEDYAQTYYYGDDEGVFTGCNNLSYIRTPKNCPEEIKLPTGATGTDKWYQALDTQCTTLPTNQSTSIELYRNGYPGDGTTKKAAFISGISINNMIYNGQSARFTGTAVVTDSGKNKITDATLSYSYIGTLADESDYKETAQAPSNAGEYKLIIKAESNDYSGQASYIFRID